MSKLAFDGAGKILGLRLHVIGELGAYPPFYDIAHLTGLMATGNYAIPAVHFKASNVFTNTIAVAAYRGAGRPEAIYYVERAIEMVADELGMDACGTAARGIMSSRSSSPIGHRPARPTTRATMKRIWRPR